MPAIELARLARQTEELASLLESPTEFRRACLHLLESYADHTRRRGVWHPEDDVPWVLGVPRTVLRALVNALAREVEGRADTALSAAGALWESGIREGQVLAAAMVRTIGGEAAGDWAAARASEARDEKALEALAGQAMAGWRREDPGAFLDRVGVWLAGHQPALRVLAYRTIEAALEDTGFVRVPSVFNLLGATPSVGAADEGRSRALAWRAAIARSPAEAAQTLLEGLAVGGEPIRRLISTNLGSFPDRQRTRLLHALSDDAAPGILPEEM